MSERFLYSSLAELNYSKGTITFDGNNLEALMEGILSIVQIFVEEHNHSIAYKIIIDELSRKKMVEESKEVDSTTNAYKGATKKNYEKDDDELNGEPHAIGRNTNMILDGTDDDQGVL